MAKRDVAKARQKVYSELLQRVDTKEVEKGLVSSG